MENKHLILIPGFGSNEKGWQHQIAYLAEIAPVSVILMDKQTSREEMVDHLLSNAPAQFYLAGQSMGGWVAQAVAAKAPERVSKLMLVNTWCRPNPQLNKIQEQVIEMIKNGQLEEVLKIHIPLIVHPDRLKDNELIEGVKNMIRSFPPAVLIQQTRAMLDDYSSLHLLPKISAPTLVIHGRQDALFSIEEQKALCSHIQNSSLAIIEDSGHAASIERAQAVTALMRYFLQFG